MTEKDIKQFRPADINVGVPLEKLPMNINMDITPRNEKLPDYVNKVIDAYNNGMRYKEFRSILKRQKKKEQSLKTSITKGDVKVSF